MYVMNDFKVLVIFESLNCFEIKNESQLRRSFISSLSNVQKKYCFEINAAFSAVG